MQPVTSSQIAAIGHQEPQTLLVRFHNGTVYSYANVSPETFAALLMADSVGKAFNTLIKAKPHEHPYTRVPDGQGDGRPVQGDVQNHPAVG